MSAAYTTAAPPPVPTLSDAALKCIPAVPKSALPEGVSPMSMTASRTASSVSSSMDSIAPSQQTIMAPLDLTSALDATLDAGTTVTKAARKSLTAAEDGFMKMIGGKTREEKVQDAAAIKLQAQFMGNKARKVVEQMKWDEKVPACFSLILKTLGCQKPAIK